MVLLLTPQDVKGVGTMKEAVEAMGQGFLDWARNRWLAELRQRVHIEDGVRMTVHIGAPSSDIRRTREHRLARSASVKNDGVS